MTSVAPPPAPPSRRLPPAEPPWSHRNEILLVGRVSAAPVLRSLPSGDVLAVWRLAVRRPPGSDGACTGRARSDAFACVAFTAQVHDEVGSWRVGDVVEVVGALRRRFWRVERGQRTSVEVLVLRAHRCHPAAVA